MFLGMFHWTWGQKQVGKYLWQVDNFSESMVLKADGTFSYGFSFSLGSTRSEGNWKMSGDTVLLSDYEKPYIIDSVREEHIDFLKDTVVVRVCTLDRPIVIRRRGETDFYIDGIKVSAKAYDSIARTTEPSVAVRGFRLDVDGVSYTTDDFGYIRIPKVSVSKLSFEYDKYVRKGPASNYFTIYLNDFPIYVSPMVLTCDRWIWQRKKLVRVGDASRELRRVED